MTSFDRMFHSKETYECKWYIPLADLSFKPTDDSEGMLLSRLLVSE